MNVAVRALTMVAAMSVAAAAKPNADLADVQAMTGLFDQVCLRSFPDLAAVGRAAKGARASPMTPIQVRSFLHDDPGYGWFYAQPEATYAVTIEQPPYRACAVRRITSSGFPTMQPLLDAVQAYSAGRSGLRLIPAGKQHTVLEGGADLDATAQGLVRPGSERPIEMFMELVTDYHGHYPNPASPDLEPGSRGVEMRFVHTVIGR